MKKIWIVFCVLVVLVSGYFGYTAKVRHEAARQELERLEREQSAVTERLSQPQESFVNQAALELYRSRQEELEESEDVASFCSPEGIHFRSQSMAWDTQKLRELYNELLLNKHGEELHSLSQVIVHPEADAYAAASYMDQNRDYTLRLRHPSLPEEDLFVFNRVSGIINLYDGDENDTVLSMASSLSHEYGHHFTFYHMLQDSHRFTVYLESQYAQLRNLDATKLRLAPLSSEDYQENHHWFYYEIAAEDYVVLLGSPNSRSIAEYADVAEALSGTEREWEYGRNMDVQENLMIPLSTQVPGLAAYFYSFVEDPMPQYQVKPFELRIDRYTVDYMLTTGYRLFTSYEISWDKVYGEEAVYTLVCFDPEDYRASLYPIRTVTEGEPASATIGTITREEGYGIRILWDGLDEGCKTFLVTVILPDGTMYCSEPLVYDFEG